MAPRIEIIAVEGIGEIRPGDALADIVVDALLADPDVGSPRTTSWS